MLTLEPGQVLRACHSNSKQHGFQPLGVLEEQEIILKRFCEQVQSACSVADAGRKEKQLKIEMKSPDAGSTNHGRVSCLEPE